MTILTCNPGDETLVKIWKLILTREMSVSSVKRQSETVLTSLQQVRKTEITTSLLQQIHACVFIPGNDREFLTDSIYGPKLNQENTEA